MHFLELPNELHLEIFAKLGDLDDAASLANSCRHFTCLYQAEKMRIATNIIVSS